MMRSADIYIHLKALKSSERVCFKEASIPNPGEPGKKKSVLEQQAQSSLLRLFLPTILCTDINRAKGQSSRWAFVTKKRSLCKIVPFFLTFQDTSPVLVQAVWNTREVK